MHVSVADEEMFLVPLFDEIHIYWNSSVDVYLARETIYII